MKKHIPNILTSFNLLFGIFALVATFNEWLEFTVIFVVFSLIFDFLDGFTARLLHAKSEFGKQLDSLADMVSFGLVPGTIMYFLLLNSNGITRSPLFDFNIIPFAGFLITIFSALRLAKFNIDPGQENKFYGLPTPANTILITSLALINLYIFNESVFFAELTNQTWFLISVVILSCILLTARIPLLAFKFRSAGLKKNRGQFLIIVISIVLLLLFKITAVPLILMVYIVTSLLFQEKDLAS